jgi:glycosyltransferase involved in cell wall biosynthesis
VAPVSVRVFTLLDHYLPGYRHGGPIRTVASMVSQLPELQFWIFTRDRDHGDAAAYMGVRPGTWSECGGARVWYAAPGRERLRDLRRALEACRPDVVYSNSLFSTVNVRFLVARRLGALPRTPFVLAPRGELSPGAMALKRPKKVVFLAAAAATGLFHDVTWQASTDLERGEMEAQLAAVGVRHPIIHVAKDLFDPGAAQPPRHAKLAGQARFVFVSRISRKKNLAFAVDRLEGVRDHASLDVYGPIEDAAYWAECQERAARVGVRLTHRGALPPGAVAGAFAAADYFLFPTLGENFGHVIVEALLAACPVVLSDRTPWSAVQPRGAGWAIPLEDERAWSEAMRACVSMRPDEHAAMSQAARAAALDLGGLDDARRSNVALLAGAARRALGGLAPGRAAAEP